MEPSTSSLILRAKQLFLAAAEMAMEERSAERAVPIILPLLDLEDQSVISAAEIWGGFSDRVIAASAR